MKPKTRYFSIIIWCLIFLFMGTVLTFPRWIKIFYPQPHSEIVFSAAYKYDIDPYLVFAIVRAESKYQTSAQSPVGARGLMQIMPDTGKWIAEQQGMQEFDPNTLHDPEVNIALGCWYLADLSREFDQRLPLVIAAYNAGRGNVAEWLLQGIWDGNPDELDKIPYEETRTYVENVLKNYEAYRAIYK